MAGLMNTIQVGLFLVSCLQVISGNHQHECVKTAEEFLETEVDKAIEFTASVGAAASCVVLRDDHKCAASAPITGNVKVQRIDTLEPFKILKSQCYNPTHHWLWHYTPLGFPTNDVFALVSEQFHHRVRYNVSVVCRKNETFTFDVMAGESKDFTHLVDIAHSCVQSGHGAKDCAWRRPSKGTVDVKAGDLPPVNPFGRTECYNPKLFNWTYRADATSSGIDEFSLIYPQIYSERIYKVRIITPMKQCVAETDKEIVNDAKAGSRLNISGIVSESESCTYMYRGCTASKPTYGKVFVTSLEDGKGHVDFDPFQNETQGCYNPRFYTWEYEGSADETERELPDGFSVASVHARTRSNFKFNPVCAEVVKQLEVDLDEELDLTQFIKTPSNTFSCGAGLGNCNANEPSKGNVYIESNGDDTDRKDVYSIDGCHPPPEYKWTFVPTKAGLDVFALVDHHSTKPKRLVFEVKIIPSACKRAGAALPDSTRTCDRYRNECPNTYQCLKKQACCRYNNVPKCTTILNPSFDPTWEVPHKCRGGGSIRCPEGFLCHSEAANRYSMCCKNVTCIDEVGQPHRPEGGNWVNPIDKCNVCSCLASGTIECTNKTKCRTCNVPKHGLQQRYFNYTRNDGCEQCQCISKDVTNCEGPCHLENGDVGPWSGFTPCSDVYGFRVRIRQCSHKNLENSSQTCSEIGKEQEVCNPELKPMVGERLTEAAPLVTSGTEVWPKGNFRWMARLSEPDLPFGLTCGGSLISESHILTAAHCVCLFCKCDKDNNLIIKGCESRILVTLGDHNRKAVEQTEQTVLTKTVTLHPNFNATTMDSDIAILTLERRVEFNEYVQAVNLPNQGTEDLRLFRKYCSITGWGLSGRKEKLELRDVLITAVALLHRDGCANVTSLKTTENMLCAGRPDVDACYGDSGGPLSCRLSGPNHPWTIFGIISFGRRQCGIEAGVYTNVQNFYKWINEQIASEGGWGEWGPYTECSKPCGDGTRLRARACTNPLPITSGKCPGAETSGQAVQVEEESCSNEPCL
ncbi:unnamed protein product [Owenia fusiformis]|uniref:Peptidase S1 domain-containing protein n=1 Tax=Owenia fusiformis TaxID=6347 RepID=A0A8S4N1F2_OWEFU|nr:unnamed protein product [Owenia fusiformis]